MIISILVPTKMTSLRGQLYLTYFNHLFKALKKVFLSTIEKHIRKTSVFGYDNWRNILYSSWPAVSHN